MSSFKLLRDVRVIWFIIAITVASLVALTPFHRALSYLSWRYLHITSATVFSGVVGLSALFEQLALRRKDVTLVTTYHQLVLQVDKTLITLSVSALLLSAIALLQYQGYSLWVIQDWPFWALCALTLISLNGIFWIVFDITGQANLTSLLADIHSLRGTLGDERCSHTISPALERALTKRSLVNLSSVLLLPILYYLMVFKPTITS